MSVSPHDMQWFVANVSITPSVFRAKGSSGALKKAVEFLSKLDLDKLQRPQDTPAFLAIQTASLQEALPEHWRPWGPARKALNIFLRDAAYNFALRKHYNLERLEPSLELPIDTFVARELHDRYPTLPTWKSIKSLTPREHQSYQCAASVVAKERGIERCHLDIWFWHRMD